MSKSRIKIRRRVWIGLTVAGVGVGGWVAWNNAHPEMPASQTQRTQPFVRLAGSGMAADDKILREKAQLMDPTPLFFPTEWNYGQQPIRESSLRQPGQVFGSFGPKLTVAEQEIAPYGSETVSVPEKLADVLVQGNEAPFAGLGQVAVKSLTLPVRSGYLEIRGVDSREYVISQQLSGISPPRQDFLPVEFLVAVGSAGLIGEPVVTSGSGWEEVDVFFRSYLVKSYRLGERLPPGRYRVLIGA